MPSHPVWAERKRQLKPPIEALSRPFRATAIRDPPPPVGVAPDSHARRRIPNKLRPFHEGPDRSGRARPARTRSLDAAERASLPIVVGSRPPGPPVTLAERLPDDFPSDRLEAPAHIYSADQDPPDPRWSLRTVRPLARGVPHPSACGPGGPAPVARAPEQVSPTVGAARRVEGEARRVQHPPRTAQTSDEQGVTSSAPSRDARMNDTPQRDLEPPPGPAEPRCGLSRSGR